MVRIRARTRKAGAIPRTVALVLMTTPLSYSGWAASDLLCERYALHEIAPGMSHDRVRSKMGGEGVRTLIRIPGAGETSGVDYPSPTSDLYVEYDRRVDRGSPARALRVRVSMPLLPATVQTLVSRFGLPDAGSDNFVEGLREGPAVWVDEACGVVLTAYRSSMSWWSAGGGTLLQVETLDLVRQGGSPASGQLREILARKNGPATTPARTIPKAQPAPPPLSVKVMVTIKAPPPAPVASAIPPSPPPLPESQGTSKPPDGPAERIMFVPPVNPATSKSSGEKGHVTLAIIVRPDGFVANRARVVAVQPAGRGFEEAAVDAVQRWRFRPAIRGGRPVVSSLSIDVDFE